MDRFQRTVEPDHLKAARDELCQGAYLAGQVGDRLKKERKQKLRKMMKNQDDAEDLGGYRFLKELFA